MNAPSSPVSSPQVLARWVDTLFQRLERIQRPGVFVAVAAQFLVLCGMILMQMIPHVSGTTVWLKVVPVDPRDMFKGDYVILSYRMSQSSNAAGWVSSDDVPAGTPVYVTLVPDDDGIHHRADQYLKEPPTSGLYIKGTRQAWNRIEYGIESFYVQAGTGLDYEQAARTGTLSAEVAIGGDGQAGLKRLQVKKR
jgi:uncharacterized membrane-anchored protein